MLAHQESVMEGQNLNMLETLDKNDPLYKTLLSSVMNYPVSLAQDYKSAESTRQLLMKELE